ncbi:MAG: class I mannose-6-phosphate isomerase [Bryobacteraceae bacterium]
MAHGITRLEPSFHKRIWGTTKLLPWFPDPDERTGEVWFRSGEESPLLAKLIFTSAKLSVQVHPADDFARQHENSRGKTEMWHVLEAAPGAVIAMGFRDHITREQFEDALRETRVEDLLQWVPAQAGDTFFIPAGVVHAIGAGLTICEIQQNSDITYRLYDYGRPRELHLEKGLAVSQFKPHEGKVSLPVRCAHFSADILTVSGSGQVDSGPGQERMWMMLEGSGTLNGKAYRKGELWKLDDNCAAVTIAAAEPTRILAASV